MSSRQLCVQLLLLTVCMIAVPTNAAGSGTCPPGVPIVSCVVDPCLLATCPEHPDAICKSNFCGGCNAEFFDRDGNEVTDTCVDCSAVICLAPDCDDPLPPPPGQCCSSCPLTDCSTVRCAKPPCLNPLPADPDNGICCPKCPPVDCSAVLCAVPTCPNPIPADIENGICCATCPPVDCRLVFCAAPNCPNPIPADIEKGICCPICPKGSTCPVDGQFFRSDGSGCPPTCDNPKITCDAKNVPGCHCPPGQVIDTVGRTCFTLDECPDVNICKLPKEPGPCRGSFPRFFFNSETGECEKFIFGGCQGNENNFQTLKECRRACDSNIQCEGLQCPPLTCPDPTLPDPDNGICCGSCPKGSTCPVEGQVFAQCKGCPVTCANRDEIIFCPAVCIPGCRCPNGQVIDEETNSCVDPKDCTPTCQLSPDPGPCEAAITRYFYNTTSKQCETFIYGGCEGNDNNFQSLLECELKCSECAPTCTPDYCSDNPKSKCSFPPGTPREIPGCFGGCDETVCSACYNSEEPLPLPELGPGCPTTCPVNSNGVISGHCLHKWGKCVKKGCLKTYGEAVHSIEDSEDLQCWRPSCPLKG